MSRFLPFNAKMSIKANAELLYLCNDYKLDPLYSCACYDSEYNLHLKENTYSVKFDVKPSLTFAKFSIITVLDDLLFNQSFAFLYQNSLLYLGASWPNFYSYQLMKQLNSKYPHSMIGIRDLNPDYSLNRFKEYHLNFITDRQLFLFEYDLKDQLSLLSDSVSLCIHLNFFNQSVFPETSPQFPGGPLWWQAMILLKQLFKLKKIEQVILVGIPKEDPKSQEFQGALALLLKKLLVYHNFQNATVYK